MERFSFFPKFGFKGTTSVVSNSLFSLTIFSLCCFGGEQVMGPPPRKAKKEPVSLASISKQIKGIQSRYNELGKRFQTASPQEKFKIQLEARALQSQAEALVEKASKLIEPVFEKDPKSEGVTFLMPYVLQQYLVKHKFQKVQELAQKVMKKNPDIRGVGEVLGLSFFAENEFKKASEVLEKEAEAKRLTKRGEYFRKAARECIKLWEQELALRKKEKEANDLPRVKLETTKGTIVVELFENGAPKTVGNFVYLVEKGFYDGTAFHRVIPFFMAQGGDPNTKDKDPFNDGMGGPGYTIPSEYDRPDHRNHFAGRLSMANAGKDTGGSQFFITHVPTPHLNGKHTVFGAVIKGLDVVRSLEKGDKITKATVVRKRNHPYTPPADAKPKALPPKKK